MYLSLSGSSMAGSCGGPLEPAPVRAGGLLPPKMKIEPKSSASSRSGGCQLKGHAQAFTGLGVPLTQVRPKRIEPGRRDRTTKRRRRRDGNGRASLPRCCRRAHQLRFGLPKGPSGGGDRTWRRYPGVSKAARSSAATSGHGRKDVTVWPRSLALKCENLWNIQLFRYPGWGDTSFAGKGE